VVNLMSVGAPQQVMLEVTIAEVGKSVLDHFDMDFTRMLTTADGSVSRIFSGIFGGGAATLGRFSPNLAGGAISNSATGATSGATAAAVSQLNSLSRGSTLLGVDAKKRDGLVRVLAEPNIMAISGQSASFLSGGKIFIPVAQSNQNGTGTTITLEEKEFGVGLKFTPTVLDGSRINLKFVSEASELQQTGSPFTSVNGVTAILPSMTTRRVDTTVQLRDGQSFMVAGLIKNNLATSLDKFPGLGEVPVMGALFRSTEFQNDQSELMFIVTPRLVKPMSGPTTLPTQNHIAPTRGGAMWEGKGEGVAPSPASTGTTP
jgi:pilus assembly protein CpaC